MQKHIATAITLVAVLAMLASCLDPDRAGNLVPETVDEDPSLPAIEINGTRVHYATHGDPRDPV